MRTNPLRVVAIGEAMVELSRDGSGWKLGPGGDTLNMSVHCARLGVRSAYFTSLGTDPLSDDLRKQLTVEGIDTSLMLADATRPTGLYAIATSEEGERSFTYWRQGSAASALVRHPDFRSMATRCAGCDLFFFSLISLAILPEADRQSLLDLAQTIRTGGGVIAFDGNYRPALWEDRRTAQRWRDAGAAIADYGLPSLEDETELGGFASAENVIMHWRSVGAKETVVKLGASGCMLDDGCIVPPYHQARSLDTSGAGDAFDAAYLVTRMAGEPQRIAAARGNRLAGWVVERSGAIPARDGLAPYQAFAGRTAV